MKKYLSSLIMLLGTAMVMFLIVLPIHASAATKYKVTWDTGTSDWYTSDDDGKTWYTKDYIEAKFAAGDVIVIDGVGASVGILQLKLPNKIGELAVIGNATANVTAPSADLAYAVNGSTLIINCDVGKLIANYGATDQVNGSVGEIYAEYKDGSPIKIGVTGTVGKANVKLPSDKYKQVDVYNVAAGKFSFNSDDTLATAAEFYSLTPTSSPKSPAAGNQLDSVPKTGMLPYPLILVAISGVSAVLGTAFYKKRK